MNTATVAETAKPCAHPGCSCEITTDYPYCSPECASSAKVVTEAAACPCDHRGCKWPEM